ADANDQSMDAGSLNISAAIVNKNIRHERNSRRLQAVHRGDIPDTETVALTDDHAAMLRNDRVLVVRRKGVSRVMHDRVVVIRAEVDAVLNMLIEIVAHV